MTPRNTSSLKKLVLCLALGGALVLMSTGCMTIKDLVNLNIFSNWASTSLSSLGV